MREAGARAASTLYTYPMDRIEDPENPTRQPRKRKGPRKVTPEYLKKAALHYLEQRATSVENLRRVLLRKVERSAQVHDIDRDEAVRWVDEVLERLTGLGLLDDQAFAEARALSLNRRGKGRQYIRARLGQQGLSEDEVSGALDNLEEEVPNADFQAAVALARRRGLGPWRLDPETRSLRRDRDMAALARAGFDYSVIRKIMEAETPDELDDWLSSS
ncbi:MAG: regulatory protein RecX [Magnetovibrionaceae bacterium]